MSSFNQCTFVGNLGKDPELRYTPGGKAVCNFSIAVNEGGQEKKTLWMRVVCWDKTAENAAKYLNKGKPVLVSGRMQENSWKDRDGNEQKTMEVVAFNVVFLGAAPDAHKGPEGQWNRDGGDRPGKPPPSRKTGQSGPATVEEDDIPF